MCGIVGIFKKNSSGLMEQAIVEKMTDKIAHRGPDDFGYFINNYIAFGHRRLSVIDLDSGRQPMTDTTSAKTIIFNGEIYNYKSIRQRLSGKGEVFKTNSDTEVLLKLSDVSTDLWIHETTGMFAFALWDDKQKKLMLCRDRIGIKPLYYMDLPNVLIFSSEIKSLLEYPEVIASLNEMKVPEYIAFRNIGGNETLFSGIYELPPGCILLISPNDAKFSIHRYWDGQEGSMVSRSNESAAIQFEHFFSSSIQFRMVSDVPLGTFNSGGVDSSLVSAFVKSYKSDNLHTFSVGFNEANYDESEFAEIVSRDLGTIHHKYVVSEQDYLKALDQTVFALEEPLNHPHTTPLFLLCRLARRYVTVVLTGEGADELFAGYPRYHIPLFANLAKNIPNTLIMVALNIARVFRSRKATKLLEICNDPIMSSLECSRFVPDNDITKLFGPDVDILGERRNIYNESDGSVNGFLNKLLSYERNTYLQSLLVRLDKVSMASALEARVPFLDHRLVRWSYQLQDVDKIRIFRENKVIVKKVASKFLNKQIVYRKKVGFDVPISGWLKNRMGLGQLLDLLTDNTFKNRGLFDSATVECFIKNHQNSNNDHVEVLWSLLGFELWCRKFIDN